MVIRIVFKYVKSYHIEIEVGLLCVTAELNRSG